MSDKKKEYVIEGELTNIRWCDNSTYSITDIHTG